MPARGGPAERVTQVNTGSGPDHRWPQFLPDGKRFLFSSTLGTAETNGVYLGSLDKTPPVRLLPDDTGGRFAAPDKLLTIRQGALQAYSFDAARRRRAGRTAGHRPGICRRRRERVFSASDTGVLAYRAGTTQRRQLVWVNRQGTPLPAIGEPDTDFIASPELSADEQSVVVFLQRTGDNDIWLIELARNLARRVTDGPPADTHPLWDPDGQHVVFSTTAIRRRRSGATSHERRQGGTVVHRRARLVRPVVDARSPVRAAAPRNPQSGRTSWPWTTGGEPREVVVAQSQAEESEGQFSPDGKWVAFVSNESGRPEVFVQSFPAGRPRTQVSTAGGTQVRWSRDGNEIFYVAPDGTMMAVTISVQRCGAGW